MFQRSKGGAEMKKILIIGCPGSGKSTFARALHKATNLPLFYLDMMYWNADRTTVDKAVFRERLSKVLQKDEWIIDGNYNSTMEMRMQACDTVIFLDYPQEVCLAGIQERRGKVRPDMPWVEDGEDAAFLEFVRKFNQESRPRVMALLSQYANKEIHVFKNRLAADDFLQSV
jgi:adenylate kinase family enzyme